MKKDAPQYINEHGFLTRLFCDHIAEGLHIKNIGQYFDDYYFSEHADLLSETKFLIWTLILKHKVILTSNHLLVTLFEISFRVSAM